MENKINLPYGGPGASFDVAELIALLKQRNVNFIIVGKRNVNLADHPKPASLDVWLRQHPSVHEPKRNTRQAVEKVIQDLVETGLFAKEKRRCVVSKSLCNALVLKE